MKIVRYCLLVFLLLFSFHSTSFAIALMPEEPIKLLTYSDKNTDLRNNKDAQKLRRMGSELEIKSYAGKCPICGQEIADSLLPMQNCEHIMSIEENSS